MKCVSEPRVLKKTKTVSSGHVLAVPAVKRQVCWVSLRFYVDIMRWRPKLWFVDVLQLAQLSQLIRQKRPQTGYTGVSASSPAST